MTKCKRVFTSSVIFCEHNRRYTQACNAKVAALRLLNRWHRACFKNRDSCDPQGIAPSQQRES